MQYNSHFLDKQQVRITWNFLNVYLYIFEIHKQKNQTLSKLIYEGSQI